MTVGEGVDRTVEAAFIGLGVAVKAGQKAAAATVHRLLTLRPARVDADLRSYLAMRSLSDEAALVAAEEQQEVWGANELATSCSTNPDCDGECCDRAFYADGGPTEWLAPGAGVFPSGQPADDLPSEEDCRAQHPLYREIQEQFEKKWGSFTPNCSDIGPVNDEYFADKAELDAAQSSAPGHSLEPVDADGPGVAPPKPATPGQPLDEVRRERRDPNRFLDSVSPVGVGVEAPGTGGSQSKHLVTDGVSGIHSGDGATSDLLWAAANQLSELRGYRIPDGLPWRYLGELIPELRDRAAQFEAAGD